MNNILQILDLDSVCVSVCLSDKTGNNIRNKLGDPSPFPVYLYTSKVSSRQELEVHVSNNKGPVWVNWEHCRSRDKNQIVTNIWNWG